MSSQPSPTRAPVTSSATRTKVRDVMQRNVTLIHDTEPVALAHQLMLWNGIRHLPVLRQGDEKLIGVLSERDVLRALSGSESDETILAVIVSCN